LPVKLSTVSFVDCVVVLPAVLLPCAVELFPHPVRSSVSVARMQHMEIVDCLFMVLFSFLVIHVVECVG
jgi:hypothetical protein